VSSPASARPRLAAPSTSTLARPFRAAFASVRSEPAPYLLALGAAVVYAAVAVVQTTHFENGYDLAIFDQTVWHYSRFELPRSTLLVHLPWNPAIHIPYVLGDHFHPILALLAPLYWIWPDPRMLLIGQSVLIAASVIPVYAFARVRIGRLGATLLGIGYVLFWGLHQAVTFDFHEVAFAPLLIAGAILATQRERWRWCAVCLALLLLTKEDMSFFVATFGIYLLLLRYWRQGIAAFLAGVLWYPLTTKLVMPQLAAGGSFRYWRYADLGSSPLNALTRIAGSVTLPFLVALNNPTKATTMAFLFGAFLWLTLYSPLLVLTLPLLAERMLSNEPSLWGTSGHYSLTIAPVLAMGAADGMANVLRFFGVERRRTLAIAVLALGIVAVNLDLARTSPLTQELRSGSFWHRSAEDKAMAAAVARIPAHSGSVAADGTLLPAVSARGTVYYIGPQTPLTDWVVYKDALPNHDGPGYLAVVRKTMIERAKDYRLVFSQGDIRLWQRFTGR
jgi:uncharacterized membrane protein